MKIENSVQDWLTHRLGSGRAFARGFTVVVGLMLSAGSTQGADKPPRPPATVVEAAKTLDLATFPLMDQAEPLTSRRLAGLSYNVPGSVKRVFEVQQKQLADRSWTELPNRYVSDQSASATFTRDGFSLSLMIYPPGKPGMVNVSLLNHGNVELGKLPVPPGVKPFYGGPVSTSYLTDSPVAETVEACRKLLLGSGWEPYGEAGDTRFFKQNAVRLAARVSSAPAQGGKTVIDYSTLLMSVDLPAPVETDGLQYADVTKQLLFDTQATGNDVVDYYRRTLAKSAWEATTEAPFQAGFKNVMIFRNPQKDLLTLELDAIKGTGKNRIILKHQSAAEVAEIDRRIQAEAEQLEIEKKKPLPKLVLILPEEAKNVKQTKTKIEFQVAAKRAKPVAEMWRAQFVKDGWEAKPGRLDDAGGLLFFSKGSLHSLTLSYTDLRYLPAEVSIRATGVELVRSTGTTK
ncbi:hypothetical protein [Singulisphaera sp. GP187]|uniref:hypothetical protein n=1 Tax=Singulisphaera sp. GP187 TaxID=1882752 RepID=UPI000941881E|nr:hypothetical protein [Singulisphaera sp. GP187]